jgi:hypothetical protein
MGGLNADWLKQLAPDHAPPLPGWWPLAPGWWIVALLVLLGFAGLLYWFLRPSARVRRTALRELRKLESNTDDFLLARELEHLMRRYALATFDREEVAKLSGESWLAFVAAHGGIALAGEPGQELIRAAYGGHVLADRNRWIDGTRGFLRGHT